MLLVRNSLWVCCPFLEDWKEIREEEKNLEHYDIFVCVREGERDRKGRRVHSFFFSFSSAFTFFFLNEMGYKIDSPLFSSFKKGFFFPSNEHFICRLILLFFFFFLHTLTYTVPRKAHPPWLSARSPRPTWWQDEQGSASPIFVLVLAWGGMGNGKIFFFQKKILFYFSSEIWWETNCETRGFFREHTWGNMSLVYLCCLASS